MSCKKSNLLWCRIHLPRKRSWLVGPPPFYENMPQKERKKERKKARDEKLEDDYLNRDAMGLQKKRKRTCIEADERVYYSKLYATLMTSIFPLLTWFTYTYLLPTFFRTVNPTPLSFSLSPFFATCPLPFPRLCSAH